MPIQQAFKSAGQTSVALTTANASVATTTPIPGDGENVLIVNTCAVAVTVTFGTVSPTASATSPHVVPANSRMLCTVGRNGPLFAAAMPLATASGSVFFMRGDGATY